MRFVLKMDMSVYIFPPPSLDVMHNKQWTAYMTLSTDNRFSRRSSSADITPCKGATMSRIAPKQNETSRHLGDLRMPCCASDWIECLHVGDRAG
jgi:hypothetical protein